MVYKQREIYNKTSHSGGYGLGMRTPHPDITETDFGWGGAAGAYASVDPVNNVSFYYSQHVLNSPNRPLRKWLYKTIKGDLLGEKVTVPIKATDDNTELTY